MAYNSFPSFIYFVVRVASDLPQGTPSNGLLGAFNSQPLLLFFEDFLTFCCHKMFQDHLVFSLSQPCIQTFHQRSWLFCWRMALEIKIWMLGVLMATGCHYFWAFLAKQIRKCIYIYINIHVSMCISLPTGLYTYWRSQCCYLFQSNTTVGSFLICNQSHEFLLSPSCISFTQICRYR